ncbi:MAG: hypothetical protein IPM49_04130 [Flavobacteriales bacterium]|nr:hypothetical protein [Flavobacteriales bacterium]
MRTLLRTSAVLALLTVLVLSLLIDPFMPLHASWWFTLPLGALAAGAVAWGSTGMPTRRRWVLVVSGAVLVLSMRYWDFNSRKPFLRSFQGLAVGDTKEQAIRKMARFRLSGSGRGFVFARLRHRYPALSERVEFLCFTHTREGWGDSDWGLAYFVDGRLIRTQFSHD